MARVVDAGETFTVDPGETTSGDPFYVGGTVFMGGTGYSQGRLLRTDAFAVDEDRTDDFTVDTG